jgi:hypothetical protein
MRLKMAINQALNRFGYSIVREDTFAQLLRNANGRGEMTSRLEATAPSAAMASSQMRRSGKLRPAVNDPPRTCNGLSDRCAAERLSGWVAEKVAEFHNSGIAVLRTDTQQALHWSKTEVFDRDVSNLHSSWDWAGNSIKPYGSVLQTGLPSRSLQGDLFKLFSQTDFDQFFRGVLGCAISVGNCRLVRSRPHSQAGIGPQSWHEDGCPPGIIRGVLYLTDVDESSGPFQYKDHNSNIHTLTGRLGDLLVFDAMRLSHRAMPPISKERMAIDLVFMPRLPGQEMRIISAGMNHWPSDPFIFSTPADKSEFRKG